MPSGAGGLPNGTAEGLTTSADVTEPMNVDLVLFNMHQTHNHRSASGCKKQGAVRAACHRPRTRSQLPDQFG
jgi:hypothetical protein